MKTPAQHACSHGNCLAVIFTSRWHLLPLVVFVGGSSCSELEVLIKIQTGGPENGVVKTDVMSFIACSVILGFGCKFSSLVLKAVCCVIFPDLAIESLNRSYSTPFNPYTLVPYI